MLAQCTVRRGFNVSTASRISFDFSAGKIGDNLRPLEPYESVFKETPVTSYEFLRDHVPSIAFVNTLS